MDMNDDELFMARQIETLTAENAALRKDRERLVFLIENPLVTVETAGAYFGLWDWRGDIPQDDSYVGQFDTFAEAIHAAMAPTDRAANRVNPKPKSKTDASI